MKAKKQTKKVKSKTKLGKLGKLEFNLEDPHTAADFRLALNASAMAALIWEYDQWLRQLIKYEDRAQISTQEARDKFSELRAEHYPGYFDDYF